MPELGSDMTEADLVQWLVAEGDTIAAGDLIAEIETDKATVEYESPLSGVIVELCVAAPATGVKVGELIARIEESAADAPPSEEPRISYCAPRPPDQGIVAPETITSASGACCSPQASATAPP